MLSVQNIYVEKEAFKYASTNEILNKINYKYLVKINHYKDVFCRPRQDYGLQHDNQNIILAVKRDNFLYPGARVCQDFGMQDFYYCSSVMNCVCDCEYCYLKGMYPSGNLVIFVNLEDYFQQINHGYICVSYDTDLFPLESTLGYVKKWCDFARVKKDIVLEIRTKVKNLGVWKIEPPNNVIFAFSVSPQSVIDEFEHKTSSLNARIENICTAQDRGFLTRLCIDPIIYTKNWKQNYEQLLKQLSTQIDLTKFVDVSIGSFRISQYYLKNMRKNNTTSKIVNFPFKNIDGYFQYEPQLQKEMESFVHDKIIKQVSKEEVFLWKE